MIQTQSTIKNIKITIVSIQKNMIKTQINIIKNQNQKSKENKLRFTHFELEKK